MRATIPAFLLAAVLLGGCGSGGGSSGGSSNGEASKSATQVVADAKKAASAASSLHVSGSIKSSGTAITLDLSLATGKGATGSMTTNGLEFSLIRIGSTVYIKGSTAFMKHYAGAAAASMLKGEWLKASGTSGQLASLTPLTSPAALFGAIGASHGKLVNDGVTTYRGQQVVEIRDTSDNSKIYVAASGTPYPVALAGPTKSAGSITFGDWNKPVSITAPKKSLDISALTG